MPDEHKPSREEVESALARMEMTEDSSLDEIDCLYLRPANVAMDEVKAASHALTQRMRQLAREFPGVVMIGATVAGEAKGCYTQGVSIEALHLLPTAWQRLRTLGRLFANLPAEMRPIFEEAYNTTVARNAADDAEEATR